MDIRETKNEKRAERLSQEYYGIFDSKEDPRRWKNFKDLLLTNLYQQLEIWFSLI